MAKKKPKKENSERWLLTYSDLITLLMIFFVIMYSMSNVDSKKYDSLATSLNSSLNPSINLSFDGGMGGVGIGAGVGISDMGGVGTNSDGTSSGGVSYEELITPTQEIFKELTDYLSSHNLSEQVTMHIEPQGLVLSLNEKVFFESGKAEIQPAYKSNLLEISEILKTFDNHISIEGHTDNVPIHNTYFKSNWELAAVRATNVVSLLITDGHIDPSKLSATSYGEYRPVASNDTPDGRAKNRRIDIILLSNIFYQESNPSNTVEILTQQ